MKKIFQALLLALLTFIITYGVALAATYEFYFPITLTDNTSVARTYLPVDLGITGQSFIDNGKIAANGLDTNMQISSTSLKYMVSTAKITAVVPSLPANGSVTTNFYTGYSPVQSGFPIVTGYGGYFTTDDSANLEHSDTFTQKHSVYVDTTADGTDRAIAEKQSAWKLFRSGDVSGNITMNIYTTASNETRQPNAVGDATGIASVVGAATHWQAMSDSNDATYVSTAAQNYETDLYQLQDLTSTNASINSVTVGLRIGGGAGTSVAKHHLKIGTTTYNGTERSTAVLNTYTEAYTTSLATGVAWTISEINAMQIGLSLKDPTGTEARAEEVYVVVNLSVASASTTVTGISSGEQTIEPALSPIFSYDGNDYLINNIANFRSADNEGAIEIWFKTSTVAGSQYLFASGDNLTDTSYFSMYIESNIILNAARNAAGTVYRGYEDTAVTDGLWHHIILVSNGTQWSWFLDGVAKAWNNSAGGNGGLWFSDITLRDNITVGAGYYTAPGGYFNGNIGQVRIYSRTIGATEALTNYQAGLWAAASDATGLVFNLPLIEGTGNPVDTVGSLTMTDVGATWISAFGMMFGDSFDPDYVSLTSSVITVPDNANNVVFGSIATPYFNSARISIANVEQLYYAPNTIISGTTIPDRAVDATSNPATITWGSNLGIEIHYGAMVSASSTELTGAGVTGINLRSVRLPTHWYNASSDLSSLPFYDAFNQAATAAGQPVQLYYFWIAIALAWLVMLVVVASTKSALVGATCMVLVLTFSSMQGVISGWIVFAVIVMDILIIYLYRQVST